MPARRRRRSAPTRKALPDDLELLLETEAPTTTRLDYLQPPRLTTISKDIHTDSQLSTPPIPQDGLNRTLTMRAPLSRYIAKTGARGEKVFGGSKIADVASLALGLA